MLKTQNSYAANGENEAKQNVETDHLRKMFIGGLSALTNEDSMRAFFSQWGDVLDVIVMRDPATKRSRGFGFITYTESAMVDKAQAARPHIIDGKTVDSKRALPRPESGRSEQHALVKKIFVGGLKENHDEQSLTDHFSQFGNVVSVKILTDRTTGRKRGFAFLEFDDYDAVDKAVLHKNHTIKYVLVDVKKSVYKQELAKKMGAQQNGMGQDGSNNSGGYQQHGAAAYNQQSAYAYPQQMPAAPGYNGVWTGYAQSTGYQQPPPGAYSAPYGAAPPQQNNGWNTAAYAATPATGWAQNGYGAPAAAIPPAPVAAPIPSAAPTQPQVGNGWQQAMAPQNFGDYQQSYNGGPQKGSHLQGNRMNPYNVSSAPNYGSYNHSSSHDSGQSTHTLQQSTPQYNGGAAIYKKTRRVY